MAENGKLITGVLLGAAIGTVLGILFAPDKGSATRKKIMGNIESKLDDGKDALNNLKDRVVDKAEELKNKAYSKVEDFKDHVDSELKSAKNKLTANT